MHKENDDMKILVTSFLYFVLSFVVVFISKPEYLIYDELLYKQLAQDIIAGEPVRSYMYPLLYPLILAPALLLKEEWVYYSMLLINILIKTLALPFIYIGLRDFTSEKRKAYYCTLLIALSPCYFSYSRYLMAENIYCPLLLITVLFFLNYRDYSFSLNGWRKYIINILAVVLPVLLFWTKYLSLVLFPIMAIWWSGFFKQKNSVSRAIYRGVLFTIGTVSILVIYGYIQATKHGLPFSFSYLKQTLGFSFGSGPDSVGLGLLPDIKWVLSYSLYSFMCAYYSIMLMVCGAVRLDYSNSKCNRYNENDKEIVAFLCAICVAFIYVAARHSSLINYNDGGKMIKLLGRYVSYSSVIVPIIWCTKSVDKKIIEHEDRKWLRTILLFISLSIFVVAYLILYGGKLLVHEDYWVDGIRCIEQIIFLDFKIIPVIVIIIFSLLLFYMKSKKKYYFGVWGILLFSFLTGVYAIVTCYSHNKELYEYSECIHTFLKDHYNEDCSLLCVSEGDYSYALARRDFYENSAGHSTLNIQKVVNDTEANNGYSIDKVYIKISGKNVNKDRYTERGNMIPSTMGIFKYDALLFDNSSISYYVELLQNGDYRVIIPTNCIGLLVIDDMAYCCTQISDEEERYIIIPHEEGYKSIILCDLYDLTYTNLQLTTY